MKVAPTTLIEQIRQMTPPGSEVISLEWAFEQEDHNIAVFVDDGEDAPLRHSTSKKPCYMRIQHLGKCG